MNQANALKALECIITIFVKHNISYQIIGGFAVHLYGSTRPVDDIDIAIEAGGMEKIIHDIDKYIVVGPMHFVDEEYDLNPWVNLNVDGVKFDIFEITDAKHYEKTSGQFVPFDIVFEQSRCMSFGMLALNVMPREKLILYKSRLDGEVDKVDVAYLRSFSH